MDVVGVNLTFQDGTTSQDSKTAAAMRAGLNAAYQAEADVLTSIGDRRRRARAEVAAAKAAEDSDEGIDLRDSLIAIRRGLMEARQRPGQSDLAFDLVVHDGLTVISPPYDYGDHWMAPGSAATDESVGDPAGGLMEIAGESGTGDPPLNSVAGVGFVLRSEKLGIVQVRPLITYEWNSSTAANGALSHAECEGGVELSAWRQRDGALVSAEGVRRVQLFRDAVSPGEGHDRHGDGTVISTDIQVELTAEPGEAYYINVGAWIYCDHTAGVTLAPTSYGYAKVSSHVQFVVTERFTSS